MGEIRPTFQNLTRDGGYRADTHAVFIFLPLTPTVQCTWLVKGMEIPSILKYQGPPSKSIKVREERLLIRP